MALKPVRKNEMKAAPSRAAASEAAPKTGQATPVRASAKYSPDEDRDRILKERFCPEGIKYLKDVLGLDLTGRAVPVSDLYNIADGRVTEPLEAVVRPLVYDRDLKRVVEKKPLKVVASFRIVMPYDRKTFKPVAPTAENRPFVASYPCYEYLQKADPSEKVSAPAPAGTATDGEMPRFTPAQVQALEGIGVNEDRLYSNSFNAVPVSVKRAMLAGEAFDVNGTVRVSDGGSDSRLSINVNGRGRMVTAEDGSVAVRFEPQYPVEQKSDQIIDIMRIRRIGNLELDFFERDAKGHVKTDVYDNPIINKAGKDLARYGQAFGPVDGFVHEKTYDRQSRRWEDTVRKEKYQVSLVNGGLCVTRMVKVNDLDKDGNQMKTYINGKEVDKFHYEVKDPRVSKDGTVRIGNQSLRPATRKDLDDYRRGVGGKFLGFEFVDFKSRDKKTVTYDIFAVPDNRRNGFAKGFSQKVSEDLIARREETKKTTRKQNFSLGF